MQETITASYMQKIRNVQRKMRNTVDSFVRPIKALDLFHRIDDAVSWVVGAAEEGAADLQNVRKARLSYV